MLYHRAAEQGQLNSGIGVEKKAIFELYQNAVKQAHLSAQVKNSRCYSKMAGSDIDISYVTNFYQSRAKGGNVYAHIFLACNIKMELG